MKHEITEPPTDPLLHRRRCVVDPPTRVYAPMHREYARRCACARACPTLEAASSWRFVVRKTCLESAVDGNRGFMGNELWLGRDGFDRGFCKHFSLLVSKGRRGKLEIWKRKIEKVFRKKNFRIGIYFETIIMSKSTGEEKKEFSSLHFFLFSFLEKLLEYGWSSVNGEFYILMNEHFQ